MTSLTLHRVAAADLQVGMHVWWGNHPREVQKITRTQKGYRVEFPSHFHADGVEPATSVLLGRWALVKVKEQQ